MVEKIYRYLPRALSYIIRTLPKGILENASEIRLRLNMPVSISVGIKNYTFDSSGRICRIESGYRATAEDMKECVSLISRSSLYTYDETIKNGYIPLENGARAGICGTAVIDKNGIKTFDVITSISIRIHRLLPDIAIELIRHYEKNGLSGTLVFSPPGIGKTTYLRSVAYHLSRGKNPYRVGIADEKAEIYVEAMDGGLVDVITNCKKQTGIDILTKTMSPQVIICDEISEYESDSIINAQNSGVSLLASVHGSSWDGIMKRPFVKKMVDCGIFDTFVNLYYEEGYKSGIVVL